MTTQPIGVWVVDDDASIRWVLEKSLTAAGMNATGFSTARSALQALGSSTPNVVITDIRMPDMDGFQVTRTITTNPATQHIPVIMLTTKDQQTDKVWATRQGASEYIVKPPNPEELLAKIDYLLYG